MNSDRPAHFSAFVGNPLWTPAGWTATTFGWHPTSAAPPFMGLVFDDAEAAQKWLSKTLGFYPNGYRVIQAEIPTAVVSASEQATNLDQVGDAVFLTTDQLATTVAKDIVQ